jgi:hypothetical protein
VEEEKITLGGLASRLNSGTLEIWAFHWPDGRRGACVLQINGATMEGKHEEKLLPEDLL